MEAGGPGDMWKILITALTVFSLPPLSINLLSVLWFLSQLLKRRFHIESHV